MQMGSPSHTASGHLGKVVTLGLSFVSYKMRAMVVPVAEDLWEN